MYIHKNTYTYNHSTRWPYKTTAVKYRSPCCDLYAPRAGLHIYNIIYIYIMQVRFTGTLQRLHWPLTAMFPSGPLQYKEVLHLCRWYTHTLILSQTTPWHTILGHTLAHAILAQTAFLRPLLFHTTLSPTAISRTTLYHTHHFYTPLHTLLSPTTLLHGTLSHTSLRYAFLHTPILHHLLSLSCLSHPIFTFLWLLVEEVDVGLSGPLITMSWCFLTSSNNALESIQYSIEHAWNPMKCWGRCFRCLAPVSLGVNPSINPTTSPWCKYPVRPECCLPDHTGPEKFQSMALIWRAANSSYKYIHTSCWCRSGRKIEQPWCSSLSYLSHLILFQM